MAGLACWPLYLAWADHLSRVDNPAFVERAVRLSPYDADFRLRLAAARQNAGVDPTAALQAAVDLDAGNAEAWRRLGLAREIRGDLPAAEAALLQSARVSRQFAPRWALANYYARRGGAARFWPWAKESLSIGYGDLRPVFRLCWNMRPDAALIASRAIPRRRAVLNRYVLFLMETGRQAASEPVAAQLSAMAAAEDLAGLVAWCNWQLDTGSAPAALAVWNTLCIRHLLPYTPLDPERAPLTDPGFAAPELGGGFAWRMPRLEGVTTGVNRAPRYFWIAFSGAQPEPSVPLLQLVPVKPGARYRLRIDYRTAELPAASGLGWSPIDARTGASLAAGSAWLSSAAWTQAEVAFTAPASGLVNLSLICRRLPGATRLAGSLELRRVWLERLP